MARHGSLVLGGSPRPRCEVSRGEEEDNRFTTNCRLALESTKAIGEFRPAHIRKRAGRLIESRDQLDHRDRRATGGKEDPEQSLSLQHGTRSRSFRSYCYPQSTMALKAAVGKAKVFLRRPYWFVLLAPSSCRETLIVLRQAKLHCRHPYRVDGRSLRRPEPAGRGRRKAQLGVDD